MRHFAALLLLFAFSYTLPACAQKAVAPTRKTMKVKTKKVSKKTAPTQEIAKQKSETGPVLTFERTPCFGTCAAYIMQVFADGRVEYEGRHAVPIMGKKELKISPATLADMLRTVKEAHFEQFQERYARGTTDLPSTVVSVLQPNGQLKKVVVEEGAPEDVRALFTYLGNQFDALAQLRADK